MKPLVTNQRMLTWFCLHPVEETSSNREKVARIVFSVVNFIFLLSAVASSVAYFVKFVSTNLEQSLYAVLQIVGVIAMLYIVSIAFLLRHKIQALQKNLVQIYQEYKNEGTIKYLARANNHSEWICKSYLKYVPGGLICLYVTMCIISVLICWLMHDELDAKYFFRPTKVILQWDQNTLFGYFAEMVFVTIVGEFYSFSNGALLFHFISICLYHRAFYQMFRHSASKLNRPDKNRNDKDLLCKLIQFHITVKQWFFDSAEFYSPIVLVALISNMILTACAIFQLDLQLKHINFEITPILILAVLGLSNIFLYCFLGKIATESYAKMADCLHAFNWYELPLDLQKYFILMIANANRPLYYHGFKVAVLNLETFCTLLRAIYTYYMIFKTLTSEEMND